MLKFFRNLAPKQKENEVQKELAEFNRVLQWRSGQVVMMVERIEQSVKCVEEMIRLVDRRMAALELRAPKKLIGVKRGKK